MVSTLMATAKVADALGSAERLDEAKQIAADGLSLISAVKQHQDGESKQKLVDDLEQMLSPLPIEIADRWQMGTRAPVMSLQ